MQPDDGVRVQHMLDAARRALEIAKPISRDDLDDTSLEMLALTRLMEIIGEAAGKLSREIRERYAHVPWRQIESLRNRLIHAYFAVDVDVLWSIVSDDLPIFVSDLEAIVVAERF